MSKEPVMTVRTGTGPVVDAEGRPYRTLNPFDTRAEEPEGPTGRDGAAAARPGHRHGRALGRGTRWALGAVVPVVLIAVWHAVTTSGLLPPYQLPTPLSVVAAAVDLANRGLLLDYVLISTQRVVIGFTIGAVLGLLVGAVVGLSRLGDALLFPSLGALRAVPSLAWVPLLIIWLQYGEESKITLVAIGAFFPVYTTVASALRHVDPHLVEVGRAYGLRGASLLGRVQLPAATPAVVSGLRLGLAQAWLFLVAAELLGAAKGLGFLLLDSQNNGRVDRILLAIVMLAVLGKTTDGLIGLVEKRLARRW
jgi:sulfonate transport system permease protein